ncbi:MAG: glycosyltransferase family 2 protein [Propionibacteriaceae bacterium]
MTAGPQVTLGVPVYNGEHYLATALDSLLAQDHDSMEILVSDNASTDATPDIVRAAAERDSRVRVIRQQENRGGVWNVNFLIAEGRGELFKWAYYDDVCQPHFVSSCVAALDSVGPGAVMAYTRAVTIGPEGEVLEERNDADLRLDAATPHERVHNLLHSLANQTEFGLMRTAAVRRTRGILPYIGSEMFFLTEMALQGGFVLVPETLLQLRRHPEQYGRDRFTEAQWYAQSGQPQSLLPFAKMNTMLAATALRGQLPLAERARCLAAVGRGWTLPRWRSVASDLKHLPQTWRARRQVTGARPGS